MKLEDFTYDEMKAYLEHGDSAKRRDWSHSKIIVWNKDHFENGDGGVVELTDEDRAAQDWMVYERLKD